MSLQAVSSFLVRVCAIVGGIYAVSSIIESLIRNSLSIFSFGGATDPRQSAAMNDQRHGGMTKMAGSSSDTSEQQGINTTNVKYDELGNQI
jgi:predicted nucleotidyltransferase